MADETISRDQLLAEVQRLRERVAVLERTETDLLRAQEQLREGEERFRRISELVSDYAYIFRVNPDGTIAMEWVSESFSRLHGYTQEEINALGWQNLVHPDDLPETLRYGALVLAGQSVAYEHRFVNKGGAVRWIRTYVRPVRDAAGHVCRIYGAAQDVTERKLAEERLRRSEEQHRLIAELTSDYAYTARVDPDGVIRMESATEGFARVTGYTPEEVEARGGFVSILHPDELAHVPEGIRAILSGRRDVNEVRFITKGGETRWLRYSLLPTWDADRKRVVGFIGAAQDVTAQKDAEERLKEYAERLQALSRRLMETQEAERRHLARELHDEIGQTLTALKLTLEMTGSGARAAWNGHPDQAQALVEDLTTRVRDLSLRLRPTMLDDLGLVPTLLWHFERYTAHTGVRVDVRHAGLDRRRFHPDVETVAYRVVQEALTNVARHAGVDEVAVTLCADRDVLYLRVEDGGRGFDHEEAVKGTSSGLTGMRERVGLLGGRLEIDSVPGNGTCLSAELPLSKPACETARERPTVSRQFSA